jgi:biotin carboxyl carrier protein
VDKLKGSTGSGKEYSVELKDHEVWIDTNRISDELISTGVGRYRLIYKNKVFIIEIISNEKQGKQSLIKVNGNQYSVDLKDSLDQVMERMGISASLDQVASDLRAPMPGMILEISINEGDELKKGEQILILEAMKMENVLKAPTDVRIKKVHISKGESVEKKQVLVEFE